MVLFAYGLFIYRELTPDEVLAMLEPQRTWWLGCFNLPADYVCS